MFDIVSLWRKIHRHITRIDIVIIVFLVGLFLLTRLINLTILPIFTDEGIYIRWAKTAWYDASWRFISLTDGRQPLQTWGTIPFLKIFTDRPLFAGRLFAVSSGFLALVGMVTATWYFFRKKRIAYIAGVLYIFIPMFVFYDRIALVDSFVNAAGIWMLFFSLVLVRTLRLDVALVSGLFIGVALLGKSTVSLFVALSMCAPLTTFKKHAKTVFTHAINYWILLSISICIGVIMYNVQRLSPYFVNVGQKNTTFILTMDEWIQAPFALFWRNVISIPTYLAWEMGFVIVPFVIGGMYFMYKHHRVYTRYYLIWLVLPFGAIAMFNEVLYPRYILFLAGLLVIPAAYAIGVMQKKIRQYVSLGVIIGASLIFTIPMWFNPASIPFPPVDRGQYIEAVTAGWGAQSIVDYAQSIATEEKPVIIVAEGDFGLTGDIFESLITPNQSVFVRGFWPVDKERLIEQSKDNDEFHMLVAFAHTQEFPNDWPIELIEAYENPVSDKKWHLFRIVPTIED